MAWCASYILTATADPEWTRIEPASVRRQAIPDQFEAGATPSLILGMVDHERQKCLKDHCPTGGPEELKNNG